MSEEDMDRPKRRAVLKKTGAAVAAGAIFPGATAANPGNGKGPGKGKGGPGNGKGGPGNGKGGPGNGKGGPGNGKGGPGNGKGGPGNGKGHGGGKGGGPGEGKGPGGDGPPGKKFAEPDTHHVVFCGCSQVCVCYAGCGKAVVLVEGGDRIEMDADDASKPGIKGCVEVDEGRIVGVQDTGFEGDVICNPNLACGSFVGEEYEIPKKSCEGETQEYNVYKQDNCTYGTAPQFGARCGDAFLRGCSIEGKK